ncbi:cytidine deaminase [Elusimicrobium simillimum]|uniref:cytidine deaminase n=1 Tax=Elusimicrobium simillimum TaxID=3143438 RepID=UPI003C6FBCFB
MKLTTKQKNDLVKKAIEARQSSYSPYSKYPVGAAILAGSGKIYMGTNIENASYGLTVCAERTAIFKAISEGEKKIKAIAIYAGKKTAGAAGSPCGACRQVMAEFLDASSPLLLVKKDLKGKTVVTEHTLEDFFPLPFSPKDL